MPDDSLGILDTLHPLWITLRVNEGIYTVSFIHDHFHLSAAKARNISETDEVSAQKKGGRYDPL